jgi:hypothetical protein
VAGYGSVGVSLYRFDGSQRLGPAGTTSLNAGAVSLSLPARSATLAVVQGTPPSARRYYTVTPCRVLDTRQPAGPYGGPAIGGGGVREFGIHGQCSIPVGAVAIAANITVAQPTQSANLRAYPAGGPPPLVSVINFRAGQARANNAILALASDGRLAIRNDMTAGGTVHVILDVVGYFQ